MLASDVHWGISFYFRFFFFSLKMYPLYYDVRIANAKAFFFYMSKNEGVKQNRGYCNTVFITAIEPLN